MEKRQRPSQRHSLTQQKRLGSVCSGMGAAVCKGTGVRARWDTVLPGGIDTVGLRGCWMQPNSLAKDLKSKAESPPPLVQRWW